MTTSSEIVSQEVSFRGVDARPRRRVPSLPSVVASDPPATAAEILAVLRVALRGASAENSQPWILTPCAGGVHLAVDEARARSGHVGRVAGALALGCVAESVRLAAAQRGWETTLIVERAGAQRTIRIELRRDGQPPLVWARDLAEQLVRRRTNRLPFGQVPLLRREVEELQREETQGARVRIVTRRAAIDAVAQASARAEGVRFTTASHNDAVGWLRFTPAEARATGDGLDARLLGLAAHERWLLRAMRSGFVHRALRSLLAPLAARRVGRILRATGGLGAIAVPDLEPESLIEAGRVMLRVWLRASALGLAFAPVTVGALLPLSRHFGATYGDAHTRGLDGVEREIRSAFDFSPASHTVFVFRVGVAREVPSIESERRPLDPREGSAS
jgi:hypothetical protein